MLALFLAVNGLWQDAMTTVYLCGVSVLIAAMIGIPLGILATTGARVGRAIGAVIDTLQTLPSFVYLIPVVMLFRVGDFAAMIAVVLYALAPAVRYTRHGIQAINPQLIEAGIASGCTRWQLLTRIKLPLALPDIMLGINQTIMLALSMLVITALVGTRDLGQEVYIALTKADTGRGIVAGLGVAAIAIIADRLIAAGAGRTRRRLGLAMTSHRSERRTGRCAPMHRPAHRRRTGSGAARSIRSPGRRHHQRISSSRTAGGLRRAHRRRHSGSIR